jgi:uncharacterized protein DUF6894
MPRYYFHVQTADGGPSGPIAEDFPTKEAAVNQARLVASEVLRDAALTGRSPNDMLEVTDEEGNLVLRFKCSDVEQM